MWKKGGKCSITRCKQHGINLVAGFRSKGLDDCEDKSGEARLIVKQQGNVWDDEGKYSVVSHVQKAKTFGDKDLGYHPIIESDVYFYIVDEVIWVWM